MNKSSLSVPVLYIWDQDSGYNVPAVFYHGLDLSSAGKVPIEMLDMFFSGSLWLAINYFELYICAD